MARRTAAYAYPAIKINSAVWLLVPTRLEGLRARKGELNRKRHQGGAREACSGGRKESSIRTRITLSKTSGGQTNGTTSLYFLPPSFRPLLTISTLPLSNSFSCILLLYSYFVFGPSFLDSRSLVPLGYYGLSPSFAKVARSASLFERPHSFCRLCER